jgi:hypothetical protein
MAVRPTTQRRQAMAGKAIGEFSFKLVATRNSPGPAGSVLIEASIGSAGGASRGRTGAQCGIQMGAASKSRSTMPIW